MPELQSLHRNLGWRSDSTKGSKAAGHEKSQKYYRVTLFFIFQNSSSGSPAENATGNKKKTKTKQSSQGSFFGVCNYSIPLSVFFFLKAINKQTNLGRFCRGGFLSVWTWSSGPSVLDSPFLLTVPVLFVVWSSSFRSTTGLNARGVLQVVTRNKWARLLVTLPCGLWLKHSWQNCACGFSALVSTFFFPVFHKNRGGDCPSRNMG